MSKKCDAVFEGGGVKGIGMVGAASAIEAAGYEFVNLAGTSAGAIVAALLAVGYTGDELKDILLYADFTAFHKKDFLNGLGLMGKMLKILTKNGIYSADAFESWLTELLARKGKLCFGDIKYTEFTEERYVYKFQAIASDLSEGKMLILPRDLKNFGFDPDAFSIAKAVRMSMSIPIYYEPYLLHDTKGREHVIVDGGLLSNYPVWLLDDHSENPPWPTFGFKFCDADTDALDAEYRPIRHAADFTRALAATALDALDKFYGSIVRGDLERTVAICPKIDLDGQVKTVNTVYFDITKEESMALYENGVNAAKNFLASWDFDLWKTLYRKSCV